MPRTRLAWHLFAGWCVLVAAVLAGCYWLASVQLAALATESQRQRLSDIAKGLAVAATGRDGSLDPVAFRLQARTLEAAAGVEAELLGPDRLPLSGDAVATAGGDSPAEAEARRRRFASGGRYDAATGRRYLAVAVPHGAPEQPDAIVHLLADTTVADAALAGSLRWLAGLVGLPILLVMARKTLDIPNTQSATGILYVACLAAILGELTAQLLRASA